MKLISFSLFKYIFRENKISLCSDITNGLKFEKYLRGLWFNIRISRLIYPDWKVCVSIDRQTFSENHLVLYEMEKFGLIIFLEETSTISESMLWRIKPVWRDDVIQLICRDLDSIVTYREAQMVCEWENSNKIAHAITDSPVHMIPMMGGMIGFKKDFTNLFNSWDDMISGFDYQGKGIDQSMLCYKVYPRLSEIMQHYISGHPDSGLDGYRKTWKDDPLIGVDNKLKITNSLCDFIGSWYSEELVSNFLNEHDPYREEYTDIENKFTMLKINK